METRASKRLLHTKLKGHKTEPAFAIALGLTGDPYHALLKFDKAE